MSKTEQVQGSPWALQSHCNAQEFRSLGEKQNKTKNLQTPGHLEYHLLTHKYSTKYDLRGIISIYWHYLGKLWMRITHCMSATLPLPLSEVNKGSQEPLQ